ncbi:hypothetical protein [Marinivivus vitaminiproducens]|uniref:hypothetical protein n=1 Tax=Marinivivus vitaminiproducens TaxID=3035935 RepID=UPI0027A4E8AA|nr:hypothetical protein P4R82_09965 [Geminicoccaceae bacterium SCSIO 64248]
MLDLISRRTFLVGTLACSCTPAFSMNGVLGCLGASAVPEQAAVSKNSPHVNAAVNHIIEAASEIFSIDDNSFITISSDRDISPEVRWRRCDSEAIFELVLPRRALSRVREREGEPGLLFVIAHELAHIACLRSTDLRTRMCAKNGIGQKPIKHIELIADFMSGYAFGQIYRTSQQLDGFTPNTRSVSRTVTALADYQFANVRHHGTVSERVSAFGFGNISAAIGQAIDPKWLMENDTRFMELLFVAQRGRDRHEVTMIQNVEALYR